MFQNDTLLLERPNPKAKIGFIIFHPYQFYPLKNICAQFGDAAEFIIHYPPFEKKGGDEIKRSIEFLSLKNVNFRVISQKDHALPKFIENFFDRYEAVVSLTLSCNHCFFLSARQYLPKIRVEYGAGKDLWKFHPAQTKYDMILLYGERSAELYKFYTNCVIVGNPRFDDWFNGVFDQDFIKKIKIRLDPSKKTLLYMPTHGDLSALDALSDSLSELKNKLNIVVKLHHLTVSNEPDKTDSLKKRGFLVFDDTTDAILLYKIADVILGDNSSAIFEALLVNKPLVIADFPGKKFLSDYLRQFRFHGNNLILPQTYDDSIEQRVKNKAAFCVKNPDELEGALQQALLSPDKFFNERKKLIDKLFSFNDGNCSQRARLAIENFLNRRESVQKPLLYHIFNAFAEETRIKTLMHIKEMNFFNKLKFILKHFL